MIRSINTRIDFSHPRHRPPTKEEETVLIIKAKSGDKASRDRLVNANMRFVMGVARQFSSLGVPLEDLINEGVIGLIKSISMYDTTSTHRFVSYAVWWIRQAITFSLQHQANTIRTPELTQLNRETKLAEATGNQEKIDKAHARRAEINMIRNPQSIEELLEIGLEPESNLADPSHMAEQSDQAKHLERLLESLEEMDRKILRNYFGVSRGRPESLEEVGQGLGITRERVRQRKAKAIWLLRIRNQAMEAV